MKTINIKRIIWTLIIFPCLVTAQVEYIGAGNTEGVSVRSSSESWRTQDVSTIDGSGMDAPYFEASRFLTQATMGYSEDDLEAVLDLGMETWVVDQIEKPYDLLTPRMYDMWDEIHGWRLAYAEEIFIEDNPNRPLTEEIIDSLSEDIFGPSALEFNYSWWEKAFTHDDLLRQKVAFALSQISSKRLPILLLWDCI